MKPEDLTTVIISGLGKMGADWATNLLEGGYKVVGYDLGEGSRKGAPDAVAKALKWCGKNRHPDDADFVERCKSNFEVVETQEELIKRAQSAQVFLEVIFEDLSLKCEMLHEVVPQLPPDLVVWTNTSSLSVGTMAMASGRPGKFVGTHGMNPVYQMPAVEVVRHKDIEAETLDFTLGVLKGMGKKPFVASDVTGFWVNKHLVPFMLESYRALERGEITVADGDSGLKGSLGHPQGVFKLSDFIGQDTMYRVSMAMYMATQDPRYYPPAILTRMFKNNELGVKTGIGFYEWEGFKTKAPRDFSDWTIKDSGTLLEV